MPDVHIHIGRIEVRQSPAELRSNPRRRRAAAADGPFTALSDYLKAGR